MNIPETRHEDILFLVADRLQIAGTVYVPHAPNGFGVVLLHQLGLDRHSFDGFASRLAENGLTVLSLDVRGHGMSTQRDGEVVGYETMSAADFNKIPGMDLEEAKKVLSESYQIDPSSIGVVGASIGANAALISEARDPRTAFVVALSPGLDFRGLQPENDIAQIQKPVLFVVARDDDYSLNSTTLLANMVHSSEKAVKVFEKAGHGTDMFAADPTIEKYIVDWVVAHIRLS